MASFLVWPLARASSKIFFALGLQRSWVIAMRYKTALTLRLPPRFTRWRFGSPSPSPEEAGRGAVPLNRAKPPSPVKRRGSPTSTNSSASERLAMPHSPERVEPARRARFSSSAVASLSRASSSATKRACSASSFRRSAVAGSTGRGPKTARAWRRRRTSFTSGRSARTPSGSSQSSPSASLSRCWRLFRMLRRARCQSPVSSAVSSGPASPPARLNATGISWSARASLAIRTESSASVLPPWRERRRSLVRLGQQSLTSWPARARYMAVCRPSPDAPSMAQRPMGPKLVAQASISRWPSPETRNTRVPSTPPLQSSTVAVRVRLWGSAPKTLPGSPLAHRRLPTGAVGAGASLVPADRCAFPLLTCLLAVMAVVPSDGRRLARGLSPAGRAALGRRARTRPVSVLLVAFLACSATSSSSGDVGWYKLAVISPLGQQRFYQDMPAREGTGRGRHFRGRTPLGSRSEMGQPSARLSTVGGRRSSTPNRLRSPCVVHPCRPLCHRGLGPGWGAGVTRMRERASDDLGEAAGQMLGARTAEAPGHDHQGLPVAHLYEP